MPLEAVCPRCSESIPEGETDCPYCGGRRAFPLLHREPVLIVAMVALAAGLWLIAHGLTQAYGHRQDHLARTWYATGDNALRAGKYESAILDLQTAVVYSHDSPDVRLRLAEALAAAGRVRQAQAYLRALWDEQPGDATVNLQLARLAVRSGDVAAAQRYYNGAIYGVWVDNPVIARRNTRLELIRFLLGRGEYQQAQSELIAVAADEPADPALQLQIARMFLQAGDPGRAQEQFLKAARQQPRNPAAFAGAGQAAFQQANYAASRRYFQRAAALDPADQRSAELLHISELVLQLDPYAPRISRAERGRRAAIDIAQTLTRLQQCAVQQSIALPAAPPTSVAKPSTAAAPKQPANPGALPAAGSPPPAPAPLPPVAADYQQLTSMQKTATARAFARDDNLVDSAMDLIFRSQTDAAKTCGEPSGADFALLLIARQNGGGQ